jgi:hypothetical protein
MINELLKSSQTIIAALISGLIAITVAIIQNFAPLSKYRKDGKDKYKESINERLEKVYNPLIIYLSEMKDTNHSISNSIIEIFKQYGYLLTKDTFCDLYELIELQNSFDKSNGKVLTDLGKEYELLKNRLYNKVKSEFFKLQSIYYRDINEFTKKIETPWYMRLVKIIAWGCVWLTITFYIILIAQNLMLFVNANGPEVQVQSYTLKTVLRL